MQKRQQQIADFRTVISVESHSGDLTVVPNSQPSTDVILDAAQPVAVEFLPNARRAEFEAIKATCFA